VKFTERAVIGLSVKTVLGNCPRRNVIKSANKVASCLRFYAACTCVTAAVVL
jgi:hypothetical protein